MTLSTRPLHPLFGLEIQDIDVRRAGDAEFREIARAFDDFSVLLFRDQSITDDEQIGFSGRFGPLETTASGRLPGVAGAWRLTYHRETTAGGGLSVARGDHRRSRRTWRLVKGSAWGAVVDVEPSRRGWRGSG